MGYLPPTPPGQPDNLPTWYFAGQVGITVLIGVALLFFLATWFWRFA